ncbi:MAG: hypothetical protein ACM3JD_13165 [Rudaea sp.]
MKRPIEANIVIVIALAVAVNILLYWVTWFAAPEFVQSRSPGAPDYLIYVNFEQAFPLADGWLALAALVGAAGLWKMRDWGYVSALVASGAAIFLGLMDLLYDLEHAMFVPFTPEAAIELVIVVSMLGLGALVIALLWRIRGRFFRGQPSAGSYAGHLVGVDSGATVRPELD